MTLPFIDLPSPNCRSRDGDPPIDLLILHYTGMRTAREAVDRLRDPQAQVSSHYVVDEDGTVWRLVPETLRAAHAGVSFWRGRQALNDSSIGIEIVNPGHEWGYRPFPAAQIAAVRDLCRGVLSRHPIPPRNVVGHSDVAPDRKQDPGELFPWAALARNGIGLFPAGAVPDAASDTTPATDAAGVVAARRLLRDIGFDMEDGDLMDSRLGTALTAFQRHWRPEIVSGALDAGTLARLRAVADAAG